MHIRISENKWVNLDLAEQVIAHDDGHVTVSFGTTVQNFYADEGKAIVEWLEANDSDMRREDENKEVPF